MAAPLNTEKKESKISKPMRMMKTNKIYIAAATLALGLAACSEQADFTQADVVNAAVENSNAGNVSVAFDTYIGNQGTTRANEGGIGGVITTSSLKTGAHSSVGFGVFSYLTNADYAGSTVPNFMYNEKVTWNAGSGNWSYSPVKYWPNGTTETDDRVDEANAADSPSNTATSTNGDMLNFFAYAPYVVSVPGTGVVTSATTGITNLPENDVATRPLLTYVMSATPSDPSTVVDLLWGLRGQATYAESDGENNTGTVGTSYNIGLTKQTVGERVKFLFKHALAKIGGNNGLKVVYDIDGNSTVPETGFGSKDANTLVTIKSITIKDVLEGAGDDTKSTLIHTGKFDISQGVWSDWAKAAGSSSTTQRTLSTLSYTSENALNPNIAEPYDFTGHTDIVPTYSGGAWTNPNAGVINTVLNACGTVETNPILLIPGQAGQKLEVTVEYVVRTYDEKLDATASGETGAKWTKVTQTVTNVVTLPALDVNKYYTLVIHLGLTTVKFSAEVADWDAAEATDSKVIWLPSNVVATTASPISIAAGRDIVVYTAASTTDYSITVTGLTEGNTVEVSGTGAGVSGKTPTIAYESGTAVTANGEATVSYSAANSNAMTANTSTTENVENVITITEKQSSTTVSTTTVKLVQYRAEP